MKEIWIETENKSTDGRTFIAISNYGRVKRKNGKIENTSLRQKFLYKGQITLIYRFIADNFLVTVRRPDQTSIDHITHNPVGININDVRNLRWCTQTENLNFEECRHNMSLSSRGKKLSKEHIQKIIKTRKRSKFCELYLKHYNEISVKNKKLYKRELYYYNKHGKCSWE